MEWWHVLLILLGAVLAPILMSFFKPSRHEMRMEKDKGSDSLLDHLTKSLKNNKDTHSGLQDILGRALGSGPKSSGLEHLLRGDQDNKGDLTALKELIDALDNREIQHAEPLPAEDLEMVPADVQGSETDEFWVQRILYGTDRAKSGKTEKNTHYGAERAEELTYGYADITIPRAAGVHVVGNVERPFEIGYRRLKVRLQREQADKHFTRLASEELDRDVFLTLSTATTAAAETYKNTAFVFIHGFNVSFDNALYRTAQMAHDLHFDGPAFCYSWPSQGGLFSYVTDIDAAAQSALFIDTFLDTVLATPGIEHLHVIAHSMGNAALAAFMLRVGTKLQQRQGKSIDQLILAAPDVDAKHFKKNIAPEILKHANQVTLYASASDRALGASRKARDDYVRAGDVLPTGALVVDGIDTIDVSAAGTELFSLNHSTYAEKQHVLEDLGRLLHGNTDPPQTRMPTLDKIDADGGFFWRIP